MHRTALLVALLFAPASLVACRATPCKCAEEAPAAELPVGVLGVGGVFFRSADPRATTAWYEEHLGIPLREFPGEGSAHVLEYDPTGRTDCDGYTVWSVFGENAAHLSPSSVPFMINYRVGDLDALLERLRAADVEILDGPGEWFNGRFAWIRDLDGRKIELWEPAPGH